jgi:hypothetical protein
MRLEAQTATRKMENFLVGMRCCCEMPVSQQHPWSLNPALIRELTFYQDPNHNSARQDGFCMSHYSDFLSIYKQSHGIDILSEEYELGEDFQTLYRDYVRRGEYYVIGGHVVDVDGLVSKWAEIITIILYLPNLQTFRYVHGKLTPHMAKDSIQFLHSVISQNSFLISCSWLSTMPIAEALIDILCLNTPGLRVLALNIAKNPIPDAPLVALVPGLLASLENKGRMFLRISDHCEVSVKLSPRRDVNVRTALHRLSQRVTHLEYLEIDRTDSDVGHGMYEQSLNPRPDEGALNIIKMSVRSLKLVATSYINRNIVSALNLEYLRSLELERCEHLDYILQGIPSQGRFLTCLKVSFTPTLPVFEHDRAYWEIEQIDRERVLLFILHNDNPLADVTIRGPDEDRVYQNWGLHKSEPSGTHLDVAGLINALGLHSRTLLRLDLLNCGIAFQEPELARIGILLPNVAHLRIKLQGGVHADQHDLTVSLLFFISSSNVTISSPGRVGSCTGFLHPY